MPGDLVAWAAPFMSAVEGAPGMIVALQTVRRRNASKWLELLNDDRRVSPEQLEEAFRTRPAAAELFATAFEVASRTQQAERHRLLAALVAAGLDEHADLDELLLIQQTAERLSDPHIRLLLLLEQNPQQLIGGSPGGPVGLTDTLLVGLWPEASRMFVPLRLTLEREGLIRDVNAGIYDPEVRWLVSEFGQRLINYYRALGGKA